MNRGASDASGVEVVSAVPGRIRLRAHPLRPGAIAALAEELGAWPVITAVDIRVRSASVVAHFPPDEAGNVADRLLELGIQLPAAVSPTASPPAAAITGAAAAGNRAVARRLGGTDLRTLVPLGLGLLAARRAMRGRERLADAPWYVLAWYASEAFQRFHGGRAAASDQLAVSEEE